MIHLLFIYFLLVGIYTAGSTHCSHPNTTIAIDDSSLITDIDKVHLKYQSIARNPPNLEDIIGPTTHPFYFVLNKRIYFVEQFLNKGGYGQVWKAFVMNPHKEFEIIKEVAIKFQKSVDIQSGKALYNEIQSNHWLKQHENVVQMIDHTSPEQIEITGTWYNVIIFEYMVCGDLTQNINNKPEYGLDCFVYIINMASQIMKPMRYLNINHNRIYMDAKPQNIFHDEHWMHFKLGDYGLSKSIDNITCGIMEGGTARYVSDWMIHRCVAKSLPLNLRNRAIIDAGSLVMVMIREYSVICNVNYFITVSNGTVYQRNEVCGFAKRIFRYVDGWKQSEYFGYTLMQRRQLKRVAKKSIYKDAMDAKFIKAIEEFIPGIVGVKKSELNELSDIQIWNTFISVVKLFHDEIIGNYTKR